MIMKQWFYCQNDKQAGPVLEEELIRLLRSGTLKPETLVWTEGQEEWAKATTVEALRSPGTGRPAPPALPPTPLTLAPVQDSHAAWSKSTLLEVAKYQKYIQWLVLANLAALIIPFGLMLTAVVGVYFVYKLATALRATHAWVYVILLFIPLVGLITLVHFVGKATRVLRSNGIGVGLMGARMSDFNKIP
jgi:hypothetical protein